MSDARPSGPPAGAIAILLWAALLSGVAITTGLCVFLHPRYVGLRHPPNAIALLTWLTVFTGLGASAVPPLLRRIAPRGSGEDVGQWWARMLARALVLWAVGDGVGLFAAVVYLMTGHAAAFAATAVSVAIFVLTNPARLQGR